jgi:hypothetical protein
MQSQPPNLALNALLDVVIPASANGSIPAAGVLGCADYVWSQAAGDPTLTALLAKAQAALNAGQLVDVQFVQHLEAASPKAFATFLRFAYMGYYSRPDVRAAFGLSAAPVHPQGYTVAPEPEALLASLVAPVKARGGIFREC